jgi:hypothetical protein
MINTNFSFCVNNKTEITIFSFIRLVKKIKSKKSVVYLSKTIIRYKNKPKSKHNVRNKTFFFLNQVSKLKHLQNTPAVTNYWYKTLKQQYKVKLLKSKLFKKKPLITKKNKTTLTLLKKSIIFKKSLKIPVRITIKAPTSLKTKKKCSTDVVLSNRTLQQFLVFAIKKKKTLKIKGVGRAKQYFKHRQYKSVNLVLIKKKLKKEILSIEKTSVKLKFVKYKKKTRTLSTVLQKKLLKFYVRFFGRTPTPVLNKYFTQNKIKKLFFLFKSPHKRKKTIKKKKFIKNKCYQKNIIL